MQIPRRVFLGTTTAGVLSMAAPVLWPTSTVCAEEPPKFGFKYILGSSLYGYGNLSEILPEVAKVGAGAIDVWPKVHGNQREQLDEIGIEKSVELLKSHQVKLGCITQYKLGPFGLREEMRVAQKFGCGMIVTGGSGPVGLQGPELKRAVGDFVEKLKPHLEVAEETGVTLSIENHVNNLIDSPDSLRYLRDLRPSKALSIALAPYHLPQDAKLISGLIRELGGAITMFYAWQHGDGSSKGLTKEAELRQLPGRGPLDFGPLVAALREIHYQGWTEIFMHPFPRGVAMLDSPSKVTEELNRSRVYLESFL